MRNEPLRFTPILIASLLVMTIMVPITVAGPSQDQIDAVEDILDNSGPAGTDAIQGEWESHNEVVWLKIHDTDDSQTECSFAGQSPCLSMYQYRSGDSETANFHLIYDVV